jgi:hypothetical protein
MPSTSIFILYCRLTFDNDVRDTEASNRMSKALFTIYSLEEQLALVFSSPSKEMKNISFISTSSFINLSNHQRKRPMAFVIPFFASQMGLFNSLRRTFTSYKAPKMKLNSYACHTARFIMSAKKRQRKEKGLKVSSLRFVVLLSSHLSESSTCGDIILFELLPINFSWVYFNDVNTLCDLCHKKGQDWIVISWGNCEHVFITF